MAENGVWFAGLGSGQMEVAVGRLTDRLAIKAKQCHLHPTKQMQQQLTDGMGTIDLSGGHSGGNLREDQFDGWTMPGSTGVDGSEIAGE